MGKTLVDFIIFYKSIRNKQAGFILTLSRGYCLSVKHGLIMTYKDVCMQLHASAFKEAYQNTLRCSVYFRRDGVAVF